MKAAAKIAKIALLNKKSKDFIEWVLLREKYTLWSDSRTPINVSIETYTEDVHGVQVVTGIKSATVTAVTSISVGKRSATGCFNTYASE